MYEPRRPVAQCPKCSGSGNLKPDDPRFSASDASGNVCPECWGSGTTQRESFPTRYVPASSESP